MIPEHAVESAKRMIDNSPAIHRWVSSFNRYSQSAKRTAEIGGAVLAIMDFSRPLHGLLFFNLSPTQH
jgi:hypothetical protein